jgi:hypothetical protein
MVVDEKEGGLPRVLIRTLRPIKQVNEKESIHFIKMRKICIISHDQNRMRRS